MEDYSRQNLTWRQRAEDLAKDYRDAEPGEEVRDAWRVLRAHLLEIDEYGKRCYYDAMREAFPVAHRLALELECLLLDTKDTVVVSKWWDSANEALEQWREFCREDAEEDGSDTALCGRCGRERDESGYPKCACTGP